MHVRDPTPTDVDAIARLAGLSATAAERLLQERTVRLAGPEDGDPRAFVSFDATTDTVQLTRIAGDPSAYPSLIAEIVHFANESGMPVETVVPEDDEAVRPMLEDHDFERVAAGPRFDGRPTSVYRRQTEP